MRGKSEEGKPTVAREIFQEQRLLCRCCHASHAPGAPPHPPAMDDDASSSDDDMIARFLGGEDLKSAPEKKGKKKASPGSAKRRSKAKKPKAKKAKKAKAAPRSDGEEEPEEPESELEADDEADSDAEQESGSESVALGPMAWRTPRTRVPPALRTGTQSMPTAKEGAADPGGRAMKELSWSAKAAKEALRWVVRSP